jgi:hypothetical protein
VKVLWRFRGCELPSSVLIWFLILDFLFVILWSLIIFTKMSGVQEIIIANSYELKLAVFFKAIEALATRTRTLENLASGLVQVQEPKFLNQRNM